MRSKRKKLKDDNRFRLMFTLGLAVLLASGVVIYAISTISNHQRDQKVEALIHRTSSMRWLFRKEAQQKA